MKQPILLKTFNYSMLPSAMIVAKEGMQGHQYDEHTSLFTLDINFEQASFNLEGDWHFMISAGKCAEPGWYDSHLQRVNIEGSIYPGNIIDLSDNNNDGAVFVMDGNIKDGATLANCSGLLVLDKIAENNEPLADAWNISLYLYDAAHEDCEIALKIPVFVNKANGRFN